MKNKKSVHHGCNFAFPSPVHARCTKVQGDLAKNRVLAEQRSLIRLAPQQINKKLRQGFAISDVVPFVKAGKLKARILYRSWTLTCRWSHSDCKRPDGRAPTIRGVTFLHACYVSFQATTDPVGLYLLVLKTLSNENNKLMEDDRVFTDYVSRYDGPEEVGGLPQPPHRKPSCAHGAYLNVDNKHDDIRGARIPRSHVRISWGGVPLCMNLKLLPASCSYFTTIIM